MSIAENSAQIHEQVKALSAGKQAVTVIAVTKYSDLATTRAFIEAGNTNLAENRADKFLEKFEALADQPVTWHFIGNLQRRKVRDVIDKIDYFHALDSVKLAEEIEKRATKPVKCFLEVDVSGEASKSGFSPDEVATALDVMKSLAKVDVIGLMTMAPIDASDEDLRQIFSKTRDLAESLGLKELSMGMSRDYPIAIACGATFVRIGSQFLD